MVCYIHSALPVSCFILCHIGDRIYLDYVNVLYFQPKDASKTRSLPIKKKEPKKTCFEAGAVTHMFDLLVNVNCLLVMGTWYIDGCHDGFLMVFCLSSLVQLNSNTGFANHLKQP